MCIFFFLILNPEREYLTCQLYSVWITEMCSFAFTTVLATFTICFTFCLFTVHWFLIQALSLSACNNVNLFITEMEQGKHL